MKSLQPPRQFSSKGIQSSPANDQPKLKDVIQKMVEFATALAIIIAKVDKLATHGALQATTPSTQLSSSRPSDMEKPPATTSDQSSFLATPDEKWDGMEKVQLSAKEEDKAALQAQGYLKKRRTGV